MNAASILVKVGVSIFNDLKNNGANGKVIGAVVFVCIFIPFLIFAFIFPHEFSDAKTDPYLEVAREMKAEVTMIQDVKLIDLIVFYDGDGEKSANPNKTDLEKRFKKYYYDQSKNNDEYDYVHRHFLDVIDLLKKDKLLDAQKEKDLNELIELANKIEPGEADPNSVSITKGDFLMPVKNYTITAGTWAYPSDFGGGWHPGIDIGIPTGTNLRAPLNLVKLTERNEGAGYGVHAAYAGQKGNDSYAFIFGHNSAIVKKSAFKQGETIAISGNTGNSSGPHSHVEVFYFKNKLLKEVVSKYKSQKDYWFGLGYSLKGDCNKVCRLRPENVFGVKYGDRK